jgi:hypothetical protein
MWGMSVVQRLGDLFQSAAGETYRMAVTCKVAVLASALDPARARLNAVLTHEGRVPPRAVVITNKLSPELGRGQGPNRGPGRGQGLDRGQGPYREDCWMRHKAGREIRGSPKCCRGGLLGKELERARPLGRPARWG